MPDNRQILIASVPEGRLKAADFEMRTAAIPECGEGQVLCRLLALTIGAGQRAARYYVLPHPEAKHRGGRDRRYEGPNVRSCARLRNPGLSGSSYRNLHLAA